MPLAPACPLSHWPVRGELEAAPMTLALVMALVLSGLRLLEAFLQCGNLVTVENAAGVHQLRLPLWPARPSEPPGMFNHGLMDRTL